MTDNNSTNPKRKILFVISHIDFSFGFDWLSSHLNKNKFEQVYLFLNPVEPALLKIVQERGIEAYYFPYSSKKNLPAVAFKIAKLIRKIKPHTVHTHLFDACIAALPVAFLVRVPQRIYTRHHSTFHHIYHPSAIKYDKLINGLCTDIIAISENVAEVLRNLEHVPSRKIKLIYHGFELNRFDDQKQLNTDNLKSKLNILDSYPVIGVISRYTHWKGVQYIIPAFKKVLKKHPNAKLVLANAAGDFATNIRMQLQSLPRESYVELDFEKDIFALYSLFHIFVHVPIDACAEAFGQTYVEALASGVPSVFTLSGIAREFIKHKENAFVVPFENAEAIYEGICCLLENDALRNSIIEKGKNDVNNLFTIDKMISALEELYGT